MQPANDAGGAAMGSLIWFLLIFFKSSVPTQSDFFRDLPQNPREIETSPWKRGSASTVAQPKRDGIGVKYALGHARLFAPLRGLRACLKKNVGLSRGLISLFSDGIITGEMFLNRATPTLSGQQTGSYNTLTATALTVTGDATVGGNVYASSMSGSCITSSLTSGSANVAASAVAVSTLNANMASYLPLAGGTIAGNVVVGRTLYASNVNAIAGYTSTYAYENHSSKLVINNAGTGPALLVTQSETGPMGAQPVAHFFNGAGTAALVIDNNGNVGVNRPTASAELDVSGVVAAVGLSGCISDSVTTTSSTVAASATAVKSAYDLASAAVPSTGGAVSGTLAIGKPSVDLGYCVDVSGIVRASAFQLVSGLAIGGGGGTNYWDVSGTSIWAHAGSNVGVGRPPTGTYALDVSGGLNVSGATKHVGAVGIGKDPSGCSLDVSGSVNATGLSVGGSSAMQIDCGSAAYASGAAISFHFTFNNVPKVFVQLNGQWANTYFIGANPYNITNSGCLISTYYLGSGNNTIYSMTGAIYSWFAIG